MRRKLALYVCPEDECAVTGRPSSTCPHHHRTLVRRIYMQQEHETSRKQKRNIQSILDKAPDSMRPHLEAQARKMGYL